MKKTTRTKKLRLQRDIIRQLTSHDLSRAHGGERDDDEEDRCHGGRCMNPIYSALETE